MKKIGGKKVTNKVETISIPEQYFIVIEKNILSP